jgi:hypothetical protein
MIYIMFLLFLASEIKEVRIFMVEERSKGTAEGSGHAVLFVRRHFLILKDTSSPVGPESYVVCLLVKRFNFLDRL